MREGMPGSISLDALNQPRGDENAEMCGGVAVISFDKMKQRYGWRAVSICALREAAHQSREASPRPQSLSLQRDSTA
jgi:hypothetical protein